MVTAVTAPMASMVVNMPNPPDLLLLAYCAARLLRVASIATTTNIANGTRNWTRYRIDRFAADPLQHTQRRSQRSMVGYPRMMNWLTEHWAMAVALGAYTGVLFYNANVGRRSSGSMGHYYVGGRTMGGLAVGVSFFATFASTNSYIGNAGKGYEYGLPWMTMAVTLVLFTGLSWVAVAPRLRRFAAHWDALTLPDYLASRFDAQGRAMRMSAAVIIVVSSAKTKLLIGEAGIEVVLEKARVDVRCVKNRQPHVFAGNIGGVSDSRIGPIDTPGKRKASYPGPPPRRSKARAIHLSLHPAA